ncbi:MAG: SRPBCC domain-containing protein [Gammaproteobacteria bacterium]|nr:SRPBCC domain-containing protein [Gammaproteobacteria bacterium]MYF66256.1 SRPBCC domain-containing protein [Gammaproteobacteria bacterium]MYK38263.1 SRPBCC domain-containing protein [Gammaproteobacteria bacterium]
MTKPEQEQPPETEIYLTLHRVIDAPIKTVWAAWTDPLVLKRWLAPGNAVAVRTVADAVIGGKFLIEFRGADGRRWLTRGVYREVVPYRRLVHTWCWEGSDVETLLAVEFEPELPGKTRLTLTHSRFAQDEARDEHEHSWISCLAKLQELSAG